MKACNYIKIINKLAAIHKDFKLSRETAINAVVEVAIAEHDAGGLTDREFLTVVSAAAKAAYPEED